LPSRENKDICVSCGRRADVAPNPFF